MAGFGENLRREREMRGISLQEISDNTKVSVRFLEALEEEQFSKIPGGIFIRSFIRSYAGYLGLDEEQVIAEYQSVAPAKSEEDFSRLGVTGISKQGRSRAPILPWVIAVILLGAGYAIFRYSHRTPDAAVSFGNPPPPSAAASASAKESLKAPPAHPPQILSTATQGAPVPVPSAPAGSAPPGSSGGAAAVSPASSAATPDLQSVAVKTGAAPPAAQPSNSSALAPAASTAAANASTQGELVLQVAATERAWVSVKADGKTVLERVLNPNDVRTLTAKNSFDVTTGNAQGTVLTLNGVTLKPLGRYGEVKTAHLTRDDLKNSNP
ncbi:MAG: helix-turn-helix domain-containing protein [Acidobacteriota bacterium]|nr:helix-turn-helix domain-containing protein [Acidobacteriota bacterium]